MVTIKQIADLCGVSRGTVDRVINERGNVKPETKELVLSMAKELGYKPNPAGKALSARKKNPVGGSCDFIRRSILSLMMLSEV